MIEKIDQLKAMKAAMVADAARHHGEYETGVGDGLQLALEVLRAVPPDARLSGLRAEMERLQAALRANGQAP